MIFRYSLVTLAKGSTTLSRLKDSSIFHFKNNRGWTSAGQIFRGSLASARKFYNELLVQLRNVKLELETATSVNYEYILLKPHFTAEKLVHLTRNKIPKQNLFAINLINLTRGQK